MKSKQLDDGLSKLSETVAMLKATAVRTKNPALMALSKQFGEMSKGLSMILGSVPDQGPCPHCGKLATDPVSGQSEIKREDVAPTAQRSVLSVPDPS